MKLMNKLTLIPLAITIFGISVVEYFGASEKDSAQANSTKQVNSKPSATQSNRERIKARLISELNKADLEIFENGTPEEKAIMNEFINAEVEDELSGKKTVKMKMLKGDEHDAWMEETFGDPKPFSETKWGAETKK